MYNRWPLLQPYSDVPVRIVLCHSELNAVCTFRLVQLSRRSGGRMPGVQGRCPLLSKDGREHPIVQVVAVKCLFILWLPLYDV